jgi:hypothetical protein
MQGVPIFTRSRIRTECDVCDYRFDLAHGGICSNCQRILCMKHLHGSWLRRLWVDIGGREVCVACRGGTSITIKKEA